LFNELQKALSYVGVTYALVGPDKLQSTGVGCAGNRGRVRLIPKRLRRDVANRGKDEQPVQWNGVLSDFVFMDLLAGDSKLCSKLVPR